MAHRGQPRFDGQRCVFLLLRLDPGGYVKRLHGRNGRHALIVAPSQEVRHGAAVGPPREQVADVGREEFEETERGMLPGGSN